jgi:Uma2 family endonuclease
MALNYVIKPHTGEILATGVSFEEYLERFAGVHCELVDGYVIKMSPIHERHDKLVRYGALLFEAYFALNPIGEIRQDPFVMSTLPDLPKRQPDIQVILKTNGGRLTPTFMDGPADIVIEITSPGTEEVDRGDKFVEYEKGGVQEYWIFDPLRRESLFYRLNADGIYMPQPLDEMGNYQTPLLPGLLIHVPTLWKDPLPNFFAVGKAVQEMLK